LRRLFSRVLSTALVVVFHCSPNPVQGAAEHASIVVEAAADHPASTIDFSLSGEALIAGRLRRIALCDLEPAT
jgi:hypothetical protein